jgi:hypothetical protein
MAKPMSYEKMQGALHAYLEKHLGLKRPHVVGRAGPTTRKGTRYVTIANGVCPKIEGQGFPGVPVGQSLGNAVDRAVIEFVDRFHSYRSDHMRQGERVVWRRFPEIRVSEDKVTVTARFCFEAP